MEYEPMHLAVFLTLLPTADLSSALEMQQPRTGVRGFSERAISSSLLNSCDSL